MSRESRSRSNARITTFAKTYTAIEANVVERVRASTPLGHHAILGLKRNCTRDKIDKAYRKVGCFYAPFQAPGVNLFSKLALQIHPDKNSAPGADEAFKGMDNTNMFDYPDHADVAPALLPSGCGSPSSADGEHL